ELFNYTELSPSDDWSDFLAALSTQAAIAISAARAFDNLERTNEELLLAYETTIEGWARALDLKDEDTEGHSRRVTELTTRLARRMGMTEEEIVHVRRGALLHDIGKMGIPDEILRKPGALTAEEWELMKKHTEFAREFLEPIPFLAPAMPIPYSHHEKFDGSGYPEGLAGEAIPLEARLFAVVDVYDALTSDRPYRAAWSEEQALEHIAQGAGSHFDPEVVEEFLALVRSSARRSKADTTRW
ncbi:MAG: HD-GYP domain-containing protein, partial [Trueperaceae bacterium]